MSMSEPWTATITVTFDCFTLDVRAGKHTYRYAAACEHTLEDHLIDHFGAPEGLQWTGNDDERTATWTPFLNREQRREILHGRVRRHVNA